MDLNCIIDYGLDYDCDIHLLIINPLYECVSNINYAFSTVIYAELDTAMPKFFIFHT